MLPSDQSCQAATDVGACLPVRPRPFGDELAHGFLARVAQANGYETPAQLLSAMRHKSVQNIHALQEQLLLTDEEWLRLSGPWPRHCDWEDNLLSGLDRTDYVHGVFRWCPLCLAAAPYLRSVWSIKFCVTCLNHGTYLIDTCPRCRCTQRVEHFSKLRCTCGQPLTVCEIRRAPDDVLKLQAAFLTGTAPQAERVMSQLGPSQWGQLFLRIAALTMPNRERRTGQVAGLHRLSITIAILERAAPILVNWPTGFHSLLSEIQARSRVSFSLSKTFGRLYRWLYVDLASSEFAFLREGFETYLREHWWGVVCQRNQRVKFSRSGSQRTTIQEAAKLSGASASRIKQLHLAGVIEATTVGHDSGRQSWSLPKAAITDIAALMKDGMTLKAASAFLELPRHRIRELIEAGLIRPFLVVGRHGSSVWHLSRIELRRLGRAERGRDAGRPQGLSGEGFVPLLHVLKTWHLPSGAFPALLTALSTNDIEGFEAGPHNGSLGKMRIPTTHLKAWLLRWKESHLKIMSISAAASVLGIKEQVAYELVRTGLLKSHTQPNGNTRYVTVEAIRQFQLAYVAATDLSSALGTSPKALIAKTSVRPVTGPTIDGCRQYFFNRSDVEHLLAARSPRPK